VSGAGRGYKLTHAAIFFFFSTSYDLVAVPSYMAAAGRGGVQHTPSLSLSLSLFVRVVSASEIQLSLSLTTVSPSALYPRTDCARLLSSSAHLLHVATVSTLANLYILHSAQRSDEGLRLLDRSIGGFRFSSALGDNVMQMQQPRHDTTRTQEERSCTKRTAVWLDYTRLSKLSTETNGVMICSLSLSLSLSLPSLPYHIHSPPFPSNKRMQLSKEKRHRVCKKPAHEAHTHHSSPRRNAPFMFKKELVYRREVMMYGCMDGCCKRKDRKICA
jgi:hypothetical protein